MKKKLVVMLGAVLAASAVTAVPAMAGETGIVTASMLNIRSGASTDKAILDGYVRGTEVYVTDILDNGWYQIWYKDRFAYVSGQYVTTDLSSYTGPVYSTETSASSESYSEDASYDYSESYDADYSEESYSESYEDYSAEESYEESYDDNSYEESSEESYEESTESSSSSGWDGQVLTASAGVVYGPTGKETYYNLDMSGVVSIMRSLGYTGEYWVRDDGVKMLGDYVMVAANLDTFPRGSIVECSLGTAIVCDTGGFAASNPTQLDIAVNW